MPTEDLKTFGAVEMVLGLVGVSLGSLLLRVETFKKDIFVVFIAAAWTIFTGLTLVCGGKKPRYCCLRLNMSFHLATVMFSAVAFGAMVKHVPYREVLVGGILSILLTVFLVETLISLAILFTGLCSILSDYPQHPEGPERTSSNTSEPLCPPRQNQDTPGDDMRKDNE